MRHLSQRVVAGRVSVLVIEFLEVIEIGKQQGQRTAAPLSQDELLLEPALEKPPVGNAGERVGESVALQPLAVDGIVDAHGGHGRQMFEQIGRRIGAKVSGVPASLVEAADQRAVQGKRRDCRGTDARAAAGKHARLHLRITGTEQRLAIYCHQPFQPIPVDGDEVAAYMAFRKGRHQARQFVFRIDTDEADTVHRRKQPGNGGNEHIDQVTQRLGADHADLDLPESRPDAFIVPHLCFDMTLRPRQAAPLFGGILVARRHHPAIPLAPAHGHAADGGRMRPRSGGRLRGQR